MKSKNEKIIPNIEKLKTFLPQLGFYHFLINEKSFNDKTGKTQGIKLRMSPPTKANNK